MSGIDYLAEARAANPGGLPWQYDDGGREAAGYRGKTGDCVTRGISIAVGLDYQSVYKALAEANREYHLRKAARAKSPRIAAAHQRHARASARNGIADDVTTAFVAEHGWVYVPMPKGSRLSDLPTDCMILARLKGHVAAVDHGTIRDTFDSSYGYNRPAFGYWRRRA